MSSRMRTTTLHVSQRGDEGDADPRRNGAIIFRVGSFETGCKGCQNQNAFQAFAKHQYGDVEYR